MSVRGLQGKESSQVPYNITFSKELVMSKKSFAVEIKNFRKAQKLSQAKMAEKFGVSALTIYNWEGGRSNPKKSILPNVQKIMAEMSGTPAVPVTPAPTVTPEAKVAKKQTKKAKAVKAPKAVKATKVAKAPKTAKVPKAPKAAKVAKVTKKKAPWGSKVQEEIAGIKAVLSVLAQKFEAHISSVQVPAIPTGSKETPTVKASEQPEVGNPDIESILREMCLALRRSRVNGSVRGSTKHVVEWPDVCGTYKKALEVLHMEDK